MKRCIIEHLSFTR